MRTKSLGGGEMTAILMAKGMGKPEKSNKVERDKAMVEENMEVIVNPRKGA